MKAVLIVLFASAICLSNPDSTSTKYNIHCRNNYTIKGATNVSSDSNFVYFIYEEQDKKIRKELVDRIIPQRELPSQKRIKTNSILKTVDVSRHKKEETADIQEELLYHDYLGVGVDLGVIPRGGDILFGASLFKLKGYNMSLILGFKVSVTGPSDDFVYENIDYNKAKYDFKDQEKGQRHRYYEIYLGTTKRIYKDFYLLTALSYQGDIIYREFYDNFQILGDNGGYYINPESKAGIGLVISAMFNYSYGKAISISTSIGSLNTISLGYNWII